MSINAAYCQKEIVTLGLTRSYRLTESNMLIQELCYQTLENSIDTQSLLWSELSNVVRIATDRMD